MSLKSDVAFVNKMSRKDWDHLLDISYKLRRTKREHIIEMKNGDLYIVIESIDELGFIRVRKDPVRSVKRDGVGTFLGLETNGHKEHPAQVEEKWQVYPITVNDFKVLRKVRSVSYEIEEQPIIFS